MNEGGQLFVVLITTEYNYNINKMFYKVKGQKHIKKGLWPAFEQHLADKIELLIENQSNDKKVRRIDKDDVMK